MCEETTVLNIDPEPVEVRPVPTQTQPQTSRSNLSDDELRNKVKLAIIQSQQKALTIIHSVLNSSPKTSSFEERPLQISDPSSKNSSNTGKRTLNTSRKILKMPVVTCNSSDLEKQEPEDAMMYLKDQLERLKIEERELMNPTHNVSFFNDDCISSQVPEKNQDDSNGTNKYSDNDVIEERSDELETTSFNCFNKGRTTVIDLPGVAYAMIGEYLGEKLSLVVLTNRTSFKVCLDYQLNQYTRYIRQATFQL